MIYVNGRFLTEPQTGVQRYASELVQALSAVRTDVVVLAPPSNQDLVLAGVEVRSVGSSHGLVWEQWDLPLWLRRQGAPLLINLANRASLLYRHQISVLHDLLPMQSQSTFSLRFRLQFRFIARWAVIGGSRRTFTVSEFSRREICSYYKLPGGRIDVVPNAVNDGWIDRGGLPSLPNEVEAPFILAFGRSGAHRNAGILIDALRLIAADHTIRIVFVGLPDADLVEAGRVLGDRCVFTGRVTDAELASLYRSALCFVAPSFYEGFDLPPLEAQVAGAPVLASDIAVHREVLGDGAAYFSPDDSARLADLIHTLLSDPIHRGALAERAQRNADRFSWDRSARVLNEMIGIAA